MTAFSVAFALVLACFSVPTRGSADPVGPAVYVDAPNINAPSIDALDLDALVRPVMAEWQVPGLALALVRRDQPEVLRAYGHVDAEASAPVTANTLFAIGSVTKPFTATALMMLVDDGRLDLDRPVRTYLPEFAVGNRWSTARITPRHILTHRSGVPRNDVLWYVEIFDRAEILHRLRFLPSMAVPGQTYDYSNVMYSVAGAVGERISGMSWDALIRSRILDPLAMTSTRLSLAGFLAAADRTQPYYLADEGRTTIDIRNTDMIAPAAAVYSNSTDMARFLRLHLDQGRNGSAMLLAPGTARAMWQPVLDSAGSGGDQEDLESLGYGLGFRVMRYRERTLVFHTGSIDGYRVQLSFMPDEGIGIIVLTNLSGRNRAPDIVSRSIYDRLLGLPPIAWNARFKAPPKPKPAEARAVTAAAEKSHATKPPRQPIAAYAGRYIHPGYGEIRIEVDGTGADLSGAFNGKTFKLRHQAFDQWSATDPMWPVRDGLRIAFHTGGSGQIDWLATPIADGPSYRLKVGDVIFARTR